MSTLADNTKNSKRFIFNSYALKFICPFGCIHAGFTYMYVCVNMELINTLNKNS